MPWPVPSTEERSARELRHQYEIEKALALELRRARPTERGRLYGRIYDRLFRQFPRLVRSADTESRLREVRMQARALAPLLRRNTVLLEIGAGDCALALHLADQVGHVHAIEASTEAVGYLEAPDNLHLVVSGETRTGLAEASIDVAYSCHYLEHLHPDDVGDHAHEMRRVLRPEGCYVCVTPHRLWGPHDISRYFDEEPLGLHLREYGFDDLIGLLRGAGFRRFAALKGVGRTPGMVAPAPYLALESVLDSLPRSLRRWLLVRILGARSREPFRVLEQVALVARS